MKNWYEIKAVHNGALDVYIYDEIGAWGISAKDFAESLKAAGDVSEITLHINSPGGSVFDGIAIFNTIKNHPATVTAEIEGLAASMASVIPMAADQVNMAENSLMMIHDPMTGAMGNSKDLRKTAELLDKVKTALMTAYTNKTGMPEQDIADLMSEETWLSAQDAKEFGFVDEITGAIEIAAYFDMSAFTSAPESYHNISEDNHISQSVADVVDRETVNDATTGVADVQTKEESTMNTETKVDAAEIKAQALKDEQIRREGIKAAYAPFTESHDNAKKELDACLDDVTVSVEAAKDKLLTIIGKGASSAGGQVTIVEDAKDKFRAGITQALEARCGLTAHDASNEFAGYDLADIARESLVIQNSSLAGLNKMGIVGAAFTHSSSDFTSILADIAHKSLLKGYSEAPETFGQWTSVGNLSDFKAAKRAGLDEAGSLDEVKEGAEFKSTTIGDHGENIQLATYGKLFSITRQAIINDDLGAFSSIPRKMGRAAARKVGDLAWGVLTLNAAMADAVALFHANHSNLPTGAALSAASVGGARALMRKQKDGGNNATLNISPSYLLVPVSLADDASVLMSSETDFSQTNSKKPNAVRNAATIVSDARLDVASATAWYLAADPNVTDTVEVAYLDGNPNPFMDQQEGWDVDGVSFKVRIDAAAKALDHRGLVKGNA